MPRALIAAIAPAGNTPNVKLKTDAPLASAASKRAGKPSAAADLLEELRPAVVSFHFGLPPEPLLARVRAIGAKVLASATTLA